MPKARDIMTKNPVTCRDTDTVRDAVQVMKRENCGVVPITDADNRCIGVVTDRDICLRVILDNLDPQGTPLREVMSGNPLTCREEDDIADVLNRMEERQVKRIIVTDADGRCVGIISEHDLVKRYDQVRDLGELVQAVYS